MTGLAGDHRDQLDAGGPGADDTDAFSGEVDPVPGPVGGVQRRSGEGVAVGDVGLQRHRQDSGRGDDVGRREPLAGPGPHLPPVGPLVEGHRHDLGAERDVAAQVEPVGDEVEVGLDLGLGGHGLGPHPLLLDLLGEAVGGLDALDVAAGSRVAVVIPCAADVLGLLTRTDPEPELA